MRGFSGCVFVAEYHPQGVAQRVGVLHIRIQPEQQASSFLLRWSPEVGRDHKVIPRASQEFTSRVAVGEMFGIKLLIVTVGFAASRVFLSLLAFCLVSFVAQTMLLAGLNKSPLLSTDRTPVRKAIFTTAKSICPASRRRIPGI